MHASRAGMLFGCLLKFTGTIFLTSVHHVYCPFFCPITPYNNRNPMIPQNTLSHRTSLYEEDLGSSSQQPSLKHSVIVGKTGGLSFTSPSKGHLSTKQNPMAKSYMRKEPTESEKFMKEVKEQLEFLNRRMHDHDRQLAEVRDAKSNSFLSSSDSFLRSESLNVSGDVVRSLRKDFEQDNVKLRNTIYSEIDALKSELNNELVHKKDLVNMFTKFEGNISSLLQNINVTKQINDLHLKITHDCDQIYSLLTKELNQRVRDLSDIHLKASHDTHNCIGVLKQAIDSIKEEFKPSFLVSNQKCYSPKLIKYKEVLQKMTAGSEKGGPEIAVDEVVYYLDKEGFLLDTNGYYLTDKNSKQIQLDYKHLTLLNVNDLLR